MTLKVNGEFRIIQGSLFKSKNADNESVWVDFENTLGNGTWLADYRVKIFYKISDETLHANGSITFTYGGVRAVQIYTTRTAGITAGASTNYQIYNYDNSGHKNLLWQYAPDLGASFNSGLLTNLPITVEGTGTYTIPRGGSIEIPKTKVANFYNDSALVDDEADLYLGGTFTNPLPPVYIPCSSYQSGIFQSNDIRNRQNQVYNGTQFVNVQHSVSTNENKNCDFSVNTAQIAVFKDGYKQARREVE